MATESDLRSRSPDGRPLDPLEQLGQGGEADRLSFRLVMGIAWRSLPYLRPVLPYLIRFALVAVPVAALLIPAGLFGADLFFNRLLLGEPLSDFSARLLDLDPERFVHVDALSTQARHQLLDRVTWVVIPASIVITLAILLLLYLRVWLLQQINQQLRVEMMERIQALSLRFHTNHQAGDSIYRIYQDSAMVTAIIQTLLVEPLGRIAVTLVGLGLVAAFDPVLAAILAAITAATLGLGFRFSSPLRVGFRRAREANSDLTARIQMALSGIRVVKAYGFEPAVQAQLEHDSKRAFDTAFGARRRWALFGILAFAITGVGLLLAEGFMALKAQTGDPTYATKAFLGIGFAVWNLGAFTAARERIGNAARGVEDLANLWSRAQEMAVGLDRAFRLLDLEPDVKEAEDARALPPFRDRVRFRGVSFAYEPDRPVLTDVDLTLKSGSVTALIGPTGSGKTTLASLLLRLFDPDTGRIEIDGVDLRDLRLDSLRANVSIALQENLLFGTSIHENIRYALPAASDAEVEAAATVACADGFIRALPREYETVLGERGSKLSTGQRQRLGIARAVIKDAPILILDEPTAALDSQTEREVLNRLAGWGRGRAIVVVTHRLSTIRRADQIVYLDRGRVIEAGSHDELMARPGGAYRRFVELEEADAAASRSGRSEPEMAAQGAER